MARKNNTAAEPTQPRRGRPPGAVTQQLPETMRILPACPRCGDASEPEVLKRLADFEYAGIHDGKPFTRIVRRRVRCRGADCRQVRIETTYE